MGSGFADISWHGTQPWEADWSEGSRVLAFMLCGKHTRCGEINDNTIYVGMNMYWEDLSFELPILSDGMKWRIFVNTSVPAPQDVYEPGQEPILANQRQFLAGGRSVFILISCPDSVD